MILELERQRRNISFDEEVMYDYELSDEVLNKFKKDFEKFINKKVNNLNLLNFKLFNRVNNKVYTTKDLILLIGDSNIFEYCRIRCARFKGSTMEEFIDQKDLEVPLYEQINTAINFAKMYIAKNGKVKEVQRIDKYEIPIIAVREVLINAVVHRDYSISGSDIKFAIFDNRIEIISPGVLPKTLDIEDIKHGRSEIRNKVIARFFKEINYIEQWGTGIKKIINLCSEEGLKEPEFIETGMFFKVIIYNKQADSSDKVAISNDKINENKYYLSDNERKIVEYMKNKGFIKNKEARELTNLSSSGVRKIFKLLEQKGLVITQGSNKNRVYIFNN